MLSWATVLLITGRVRLSLFPVFHCCSVWFLKAQEINSWIHWGGAQKLWEEAYAPFNLMPLAGGNTGVQMAGWFNKEINSIQDLKGLKMRIPGLAGEKLLTSRCRKL
ncbi:MAG: hypothetical protein Ct9H300mP20_22150 [Gammaproteobacteria bacterium]|nr:MAG: hypothetical protein Ct9H300mP20_22150 [Gammaproteobacteria bacterium]